MPSPIGFGARRQGETLHGSGVPELRVIEGGKSGKEVPPSMKDTVISGLAKERAVLEGMLQKPGAEKYVQGAMTKKVQEVGIDVHKQLQQNPDALSIEDLQEISNGVKESWTLVGGIEGKEGEQAHAAFVYIDSLIDWKKQVAATQERGKELTAQAHQMQQNVVEMNLGEIRRRIAQG